MPRNTFMDPPPGATSTPVSTIDPLCPRIRRYCATSRIFPISKALSGQPSPFSMCVGCKSTYTQMSIFSMGKLLSRPISYFASLPERIYAGIHSKRPFSLSTTNCAPSFNSTPYLLGLVLFCNKPLLMDSSKYYLKPTGHRLFRKYLLQGSSIQTHSSICLFLISLVPKLFSVSFDSS